MERKELIQATNENAFYCCNGQVYFNLKDLLEGLRNMSDETFAYHCNKSKNDFRNWIRDVLKDKKIARDIRWSIKRTTVVKKIEINLSKYYKI